MEKREIKFKCYSERYWMLWVEAINFETKIASCFKNKWDYIPLCFDWEHKGAELLQFTWSQDKNWVDMYEWDVVNYKQAPYEDDKKKKWVVVYQDNKWAFMFKRLNSFEAVFHSGVNNVPLRDLINSVSKVQKIWNIYEDSNSLDHKIRVSYN